MGDGGTFYIHIPERDCILKNRGWVWDSGQKDTPPGQKETPPGQIMGKAYKNDALERGKIQ